MKSFNNFLNEHFLGSIQSYILWEITPSRFSLFSIADLFCFQVHEGYGSKHSAVKRLALAGALIQAFMSDSLDAHGLGRKTIQFVQNFEDSAASGLPSVFVFKSKLSSIAAHQMSQNDLWTFYAKELLSYFEDEPNVKYLAITNVTK